MAEPEPLRFTLRRDEDETGVSGTGDVAWGVLFPDGACVLRWDTALTSTASYDSLDTLVGIHGHGGKTRVVFTDQPDTANRPDGELVPHGWIWRTKPGTGRWVWTGTLDRRGYPEAAEFRRAWIEEVPTDD